MIRTGLFRYVRWGDLDRYHREGWMVVGDLGPVHGEWSVLMWHCECVDNLPRLLPNHRNTLHRPK